MKKYSLISIHFGADIIDFRNGIIDFSDENHEVLEILVEKSTHNLAAILEAGVGFVTIEKSYRFYVNYDLLWGVNV